MRIFILAMLVMFLSCKKDPVSIFMDAGITISYVNSTGTDLLNPENSNAYKESDIDIYYLVNGEKIKIYEENMDVPESFYIPDEPRDNKYFMVLFPYLSYNHVSGLDENNRTITFINFKNETEDKVECEYKTYENSSSVSIIKVWYNDSLAWEQGDSEERWIEIIK